MNEETNLAVVAKRLKPGDDLRSAIEWLVEEEDIQAGVLLCAVGSLSQAALRLASGSVKDIEGPLEIVSAIGTVGSGGIHIHLSASDQNGKTLGGHLVKGCIVRTTIELVIQDLSAYLIFDRAFDEKTGYRELVVGRASK